MTDIFFPVRQAVERWWSVEAAGACRVGGRGLGGWLADWESGLGLVDPVRASRGDGGDEREEDG